MHTIGFFQLVGHRVDQQVLAGAPAVAAAVAPAVETVRELVEHVRTTEGAPA